MACRYQWSYVMAVKDLGEGPVSLTNLYMYFQWPLKTRLPLFLETGVLFGQPAKAKFDDFATKTLPLTQTIPPATQTTVWVIHLLFGKTTLS